MSNPFANNEPQQPEQPDYDTYRYPSGGETTPGAGASASNEYAGYGGYQEPAYGAAGYGAGPGGSTWAMEAEKNGVAPWALGIGILSLIVGVSMIFSGLAFLPGIIGLIVSIVAIVKARKLQGPGRRMGMSVAGLILSILAIVASILFWLLAVFILNDSGVMECFSITDPAAQQTCINDALDTWANS